MASSDHHARAVFATTARLLSCLVTESLVRALYIPIPIAAPELVSVGAAVVFASAAPVPPAFFVDGGPIPTDTDVLVVVPLHHAPSSLPVAARARSHCSTRSICCPQCTRWTLRAPTHHT